MSKFVTRSSSSALLTVFLVSQAPVVAQGAAHLDPALSGFVPLLGGSWLGEGLLAPDGGPFFAGQVFEPALGGRAVRVRTYALRGGEENPSLETLITASPGGGLEVSSLAASGMSYRGTAAVSADRIELHYVESKSGQGSGQTFELHGSDTYSWTSFDQDGEGRVETARADFERRPLVPDAIGGRAVYAEILVPAPVDRVWEAWTTPDGIRSFLARECEIELAVGGKYEIYFNPAAEEGRRGSEGARILAIDPGRMLAFTWNAPPTFAVREQFTSVVVRFEPLDEQQTMVSLENFGYGSGDDWDAALEYFTEAWPTVLSRLRSRFVDGPRDWSRNAPASSTEPGLARFPYSPEEIREFNRPGTVIRSEDTADGATRYAEIRWTDGDEETGTFEQTVRDGLGEVLARHTIHSRWEELQRHASFPVESTEISDVELDTLMGRMSCWVYEVDGDGTTERYWFGKTTPGQPLRFEARGSDGRVTRVIQVVSIDGPAR